MAGVPGGAASRYFALSKEYVPISVRGQPLERRPVVRGVGTPPTKGAGVSAERTTSKRASLLYVPKPSTGAPRNASRLTSRSVSPASRAARIASTSFSVSGVRDRLVGLNTTPKSGSPARGLSLPTPCFACSHMELSRSIRSHVFGLSPPASTKGRLYGRGDLVCTDG